MKHKTQINKWIKLAQIIYEYFGLYIRFWTKTIYYIQPEIVCPIKIVHIDYYFY